MIFWDTSALVPVLVHEPSSPRVRELLTRDPDLIVWWGTPVECLSALARQEREGTIGAAGVDDARRILGDLEEIWSEIFATEAVREYADLVLRRHPIRAADALQVAAALTWARGRPSGHRFATLDERMGRVARSEGFEPAF